MGVVRENLVLDSDFVWQGKVCMAATPTMLFATKARKHPDRLAGHG
jgi:hypothetical protein